MCSSHILGDSEITSGDNWIVLTASLVLVRDRFLLRNSQTNSNSLCANSNLSARLCLHSISSSRHRPLEVLNVYVVSYASPVTPMLV